MPSRRVFRHWVEGDLDLAEAMVRVRQARREERVGRCQGRRRAFDPVLADRIYARVAMGGVLERVLRADPALPSRPVFARWRREAPDFDRRFRQMLRHIHRHRCRHRLFQPALVAEIANRVRMGATLARIGREPGMPCSTTLYAWRRRHPGFAEALAEAREDRLDVLRDEMLAILEAETPATRAAGRRRIANLGQRLDRLSRRLAEGRGG
jgi:transposase-like protein